MNRKRLFPDELINCCAAICGKTSGIPVRALEVAGRRLAKQAGCPIGGPMAANFAINRKAADAIGIGIPPEVRQLADRCGLIALWF